MPEVSERQQLNRQNLLDASEQISNNVPGLALLHAIHVEFDRDWYEYRTTQARNWVATQIIDISAAYHIAEDAGHTPGN